MLSATRTLLFKGLFKELLQGLLVALLPAIAAILQGPLAAADIFTTVSAKVDIGQPLSVLLRNPPNPEREGAFILQDPYARLVAVVVVPGVQEPAEVAPPAPGAPDSPPPLPRYFRTIRVFEFVTTGLPAGVYTVKYALRSEAEEIRYETLAAVPVTLVATTSAVAGTGAALANQAFTRWQPVKPLQFWRGVPLTLDPKADWEQLLRDAGLTGAAAPFDGPTMVVPRGSQLSRLAIESDLMPVLRGRGLVICETWPAPLAREDMNSVEALTGLIGPAVNGTAEAGAEPAANRIIGTAPGEFTRTLAKRDPESHRLYGLCEQSFLCLTPGLKTYPSTTVLRWAPDRSPAITLRLYPAGGAVLVLNAPVAGYAALSAEPAATAVARMDLLGATPAQKQAVLKNLHGGAALRAALADVHAVLSARRPAIGETGPLWNLTARIVPEENRIFRVQLKFVPTARTLPSMTPPATVWVRLDREPETDEEAYDPSAHTEWTVPITAKAGFQVFRIPMDSTAGWTLSIYDPCSGTIDVRPVPTGAPAQIEIVDAPPPPPVLVPPAATTPAAAPLPAPGPTPAPVPPAPAAPVTPAPGTDFDLPAEIEMN